MYNCTANAEEVVAEEVQDPLPLAPVPTPIQPIIPSPQQPAVRRRLRLYLWKYKNRRKVVGMFRNSKFITL